MGPQEAVSPMEASWLQVSSFPTHQHLWNQEEAPSFLTPLPDAQPQELLLACRVLSLHYVAGPLPHVMESSGEEVPWVNIWC